MDIEDVRDLANRRAGHLAPDVRVVVCTGDLRGSRPDRLVGLSLPDGPAPPGWVPADNGGNYLVPGEGHGGDGARAFLAEFNAMVTSAQGVPLS